MTDAELADVRSRTSRYRKHHRFFGIDEVDREKLLAHIEDLQAILHDLREESTAYSQGWKDAIQALRDQAAKGHDAKAMEFATWFRAAADFLSERPPS